MLSEEQQVLSEEQQEQLIKLFEDRFKDYNTKVLESLGEIIGKFKDLTPSQAYKLGQMLKYDKSIKEIVKELSRLSDETQEEITKVLEEVAKKNTQFAETFYKARGIKTPIYKENKQLQNIVNSVANLTKDTFKNISRTTGFKLLDGDGVPLLLDIEATYKEVIDRSIIAVVEGKETYQQVMSKTIKQLSESGVRKIEFESGYSRRLDSTVRMNVLDGMRQVSNESQKLFGKEFDSDGVEISVHINPAPDHQYVQGKQFSNKEFKKFQNNEDSISYDGVEFPAISEETGQDRRSISEYNCYHYIFAIVLGVSSPIYSEKQLNDIIDQANKTFEFEGKKYTIYEGTQLQRRIETAIREAKDEQIMNKASGFNEDVLKNQKRISDLTSKYKDLCEASGLQNQLSKRARVSGYKRVAKNKLT